jgi:hypothetical protein
MKNLLAMTTALVAMSTAVFAQDSAPTVAITGGVGIEVTEQKDGDFGAKTELSLGVSTSGNASASIDLLSTDEGALSIDGWTLGMTKGDSIASIGDQGDIFPGAGLEVVGDDTLADPADNDSIRLVTNDLSLHLGFTDMTDDVTDLSNVQVGYAMGIGGASVNPVIDFNLDSKDTTFGVAGGYTLGDVALGGVMTYGDDIAYEASVAMNGMTAFTNGDEDDALQNIGLGWKGDVNGLTLFAEGAYNMDSEDIKPAVGASFSF